MSVNQIDALCAQWLLSKEEEQRANERRITLEKQILELSRADIPPEGISQVGPLKICTGFTRSWDSKRLTDIYRIKPPVFPFRIDWKEDRRLTRKYEMNDPKVMSIFAEALTIKEKKPTFIRVDDV